MAAAGTVPVPQCNWQDSESELEPLGLPVPVTVPRHGPDPIFGDNAFSS